MIDANGLYTLVLEDLVFGVQLGIVGTVVGADVDEVFGGMTADNWWEVCSNGCCQSQEGVGDYAGVLFKLVPSRIEPDEIRALIAANKDEYRQMVKEQEELLARFGAFGSAPVEEDMN